MEQIPKSLAGSLDHTATMTPAQMFESETNDIGIQYAINALSKPNDDTYRRNLARYLDTKGFDLVNKDRQLYIGSRDSLQTKPVTTGFLGSLVGDAPEIISGILGSRAGMVGAVGGSVFGDAVQQSINKYFLGEELTPEQRSLELAKSGSLGLGGEIAGKVIGRAITPLTGISKATQEANNKLASKYNVNLTPASATQHKGLAQFEEVMQKGSLGGKGIAKAKEQEITGIENIFRDLTENKMGATGGVSDSGSQLAEAMQKQKDYASNYFNQEYGNLIEEAGIAEIGLNNFKQVAKNILKQSEEIPAFKNGIDSFSEKILQSPNALSYKDYQQLRTFVGGKIKDASTTGQSGSKEAYKKLYKALNEDFDVVFANTPFHSAKRALDTSFKQNYKIPFEDNFTRNALGSGIKTPTDPERLGGLISNSSGKAGTSARTADAGFGYGGGGGRNIFDLQNFKHTPNQKPAKSMSTSADYLLSKSEALDGGISLAKARTTLKKATGLDELFGTTDGSKLASAFEPNKTELGIMRDDIIKLIEISGKNKQIGNSSGTAYMNELIKMKNDPWNALLGFVSDRGMDVTYKRKLFQKWLTNGIITKDQQRQLIKSLTQVSVRSEPQSKSR